MNEVNFVYWLQGFFELSKAETLTEEQIKIIKAHIELVTNSQKPVNFPYTYLQGCGTITEKPNTNVKSIC